MCGLFGSSDCFGYEEVRFYGRGEVIWIDQCWSHLWYEIYLE